jgi:sugar phosphate isomerase/epimerase
MELGISSYTYGWAVGVPGYDPVQPLDEQKLIDLCLSHGVKVLQVCDNLPLQALARDRRERFADRAASEGLRIEAGSRGLTLEHAVEMISLAREVNAKLLRFVIDGKDVLPEPHEVLRVLRHIAPMLEDMRLGLENHDRFAARTLRSIVEDAGNERIGICLDTANSLGAGEGLESVVAELAPLTFNLHIKDFHIARLPHQIGFLVEGRPAGGGMLDLGWLLGKLAPHGHCETAVLELWTPPEARIEATITKEADWAETSLKYLSEWFPRLDRQTDPTQRAFGNTP